MTETTFEADTLQAALDKAAAALGVEAADIEHQVVEKKRDFWGAGDDTVVIKAWRRAAPQPEPEPREAAPAQRADDAQATADDEDEAKASRRRAAAEPWAKEEAEEEAETEDEEGAEPAGEEGAEPWAEEAAEPAAWEAAREPREARPERARRGEERRPRREAEDDDGDEAGEEADIELAVDEGEIAALLAQIFHDMEFDCSVEVQAEDEGFLASVSGADKEELLEGNGRCLSALELLVNNAFRNKLPRNYKIRVDAGDFRSRRDQELADLAYQVAHSAKQSGRTQETQPLNPYERRLVHLALAEDSAVTTRSRGSGFLKNVQVIPESGGRGGRGRRR
jgi:spoIIIJ-associated protein